MGTHFLWAFEKQSKSEQIQGVYNIRFEIGTSSFNMQVNSYLLNASESTQVIFENLDEPN